MFREDEDFIQQLSRDIEENTMTTRGWAECVASCILSTVMGPKRYLCDRMSKLNLNLWFLMIGPSGLARKSLPFKSYLFPALIKTTEYLPDKYPLLLPSRFSVEGLITHLQTSSMGCMARDEFTSMFKEAYGKQYLSDVIEFLSELYDGTIQKRTTIAHGTQEVRDVYVTMIAATTPHLYKVMKPDFFVQGTGNRILYEVYEDTEQTKINSEDFFQSSVFEQEREDKLDQIAKSLAQIRYCNVQYLIPDEEACDRWTEFEYGRRIEAQKRFREDPYDLHYTYITRMGEMSLKLSGLFAMSRAWGRVVLKDAPTELIVTREDVDRAIKKIDYHYGKFCRMLDSWRVRPEPLAARTLNEQALFVSEQLRQEGSKGVKWSELRKLTKWEVSTWREVLKFLLDTNAIIITEGLSTGGRKPMVLYDGLIKMAEIHGKPLDWSMIEMMLLRG